MSDSNIDKIIEIIDRSEIKRDLKQSYFHKKDFFNIYFNDINDRLAFIDLMNLNDNLEEYSLINYCDSLTTKGYFSYSIYRINNKYKNEFKNKIERIYADNDIVFEVRGYLKDKNKNKNLNDFIYYCLGVSKIDEENKDKELKDKISNMINSLHKNRLDKDDVFYKHIMSYAINRFISNNVLKIGEYKISDSIKKYNELYKNSKEYQWAIPFYIKDEKFLNNVSQIFDITSKNKLDGLAIFVSRYRIQDHPYFYFIKNCNKSNIYEIEPTDLDLYSETLPNNIFIYKPPIFYDVYKYLRDKELNVENVIEVIDIYYKKYKKFANEVFNYIDKKAEKVKESFLNEFWNDYEVKNKNNMIFESN